MAREGSLRSFTMPNWLLALFSRWGSSVRRSGEVEEEEIGEGDEIKVGEHRVQVLHTPGHSPGHVCFYVESEKLMVSGDLIFEGSIGRTDLPLCDGQAMMASLERIKRDIPRDTTLFPGHMGVTTMGKEIDTDPFLR